MKIIRGLLNLPRPWQETVVTIGNFDGLHLGHQALIHHCLSLSKQQGCPSVLITFEPYPRDYFSRHSTTPRLMSLRDKFLTLQSLGMDYLCVLPFNARLAHRSAEDFVRTVLVQALQTKFLVVGDDFRFGANRQGDYALLLSQGKRYGFSVEKIQTHCYQAQRISSTQLRAALGNGDLALSEKLLGRPYSLSGKVVLGDQRGKRLSMPTANLFIKQKKLPLSGIFVATFVGATPTPWPALASVGYRPMYPTTRETLEVHLLDFSGNLYGKHGSVYFLKKIRNQQYFTSEAELREKMKEDEQCARDYFRSQGERE